MFYIINNDSTSLSLKGNYYFQYQIWNIFLNTKIKNQGRDLARKKQEKLRKCYNLRNMSIL